MCVYAYYGLYYVLSWMWVNKRTMCTSIIHKIEIWVKKEMNERFLIFYVLFIFIQKSVRQGILLWKEDMLRPWKI